MKKFKSLASTHIRKIAILLVISTLSSTILCSCDDDKNSTQIETETEDETDVTTQENTEKPVKDTTTEQTVKQDADTTEEADKETAHQSNDTKPSTTPHTSQSTNTEQTHVHKFTQETYYTTETQTVHHDAVTHQETTYTTEQIAVASGYVCDDGAFFEDEGAAAAYADEHWLGYCSGCKYETVQVPHTTTVVDKPAWDEEVEVQVPHTRNVCSCGATE